MTPHRLVRFLQFLAACGILWLILAIGSPGSESLAQSEDAALENELDRIARETATLRELPPLETVDDISLTREELQAMMPVIMAEELDRGEVAAQARAFAALGLLPAETDLFDLSVQLMGEQAMGFYDPLTDEMLVVAGGNPGVTEYFYAHEIVHALQDAHLDPDDLLEDLSALNGDEALAALALYEGDAVATSNAYLAAHPALAIAILQELQTDFPELDQAPASVSVPLVFPYSEGLAFVERLRAEGGWEAVNAAYHDRPVSTEQILHPRRYLVRDSPSDVVLPDPNPALGSGWRIVFDDILGELQTALLLADLQPGEGFNQVTGNIELPEAARNAAAGWDGDRFALWEDPAGSQEVLVWRSVWDTPQDARAFSRALAQFGNARWGGVFNGEDPDDVALVTGDIAARIELEGQEVRFAQAPDLATVDAAMASVRAALALEPPTG